MIGTIEPPEELSLIILTYNRLKFFKKMLETLIKNTSWKLRIIVVDNNSSSKDLKDYLISKINDKCIDECIFSETNTWSSGFLKAERLIENSKNFLISDPDILVQKLEPCWLEQLYSLFKKYNMDRLGVGLDDINHPEPPTYKKFIGDNNEIIDVEIATTLQIINNDFFKKSEKFDDKNHPSRLMKRLLNAKGKIGFTNHFRAYHLGWDERKEYPEYLDMKIKKYFHPEYLKYKGE